MGAYLALCNAPAADIVSWGDGILSAQESCCHHALLQTEGLLGLNPLLSGVAARADIGLTKCRYLNGLARQQRR